MTAAYRMKGLGWFGSCVAVVLGFYLVSLQVAAERKTLEDVNTRIDAAQRDIRALETEFDTRANLAQLERWNGDTLALAAPTASQFVRDEAQLASIDVNSAGNGVETAALVVPSLPTAQPKAPAAPAAIPAPAVVQVTQVTAAAPVRSTAVIRAAAVRIVGPTAGGTSQPVLARLASAARATAAVAKVRPQAVAMLDKKLLSDTTFGDIMSGARAEAGRLR